jgi:hypothetical protein
MLQALENEILREVFGSERDEVSGEFKMLHNEEHQVLHRSSDILRVLK